MAEARREIKKTMNMGKNRQNAQNCSTNTKQDFTRNDRKNQAYIG